MRGTHRFIFFFAVFLGLFLASSPGAFGQGVQTGGISGVVRLPDGALLPGVTVTVESPALQGKRTQVTGAHGDYMFKFLPPGNYKVVFELEGMKTATSGAEIGVGGSARADVTLEPATSEAVTVNAEALEASKAAVHSSTYEYKEIDKLPIGRTIDQVSALAPGLTTNTANGGLQIGGALSYDNVFLVDGVDINDNLFGTPTNNLVIPEALQETKVLTSAISAEYGRFTGGVVNAVTKSGGNDFHGSFRVDLANDDWQSRTPYEVNNDITHPNKLNESYTGTIGGKILTDRIWFFGAGRYIKTQAQQTLDITNETYINTDEEPRYQGKLTLNLAQNHSLQGSYTHSDEKQVQGALGITIETTGLVHPSFPTDLWVASYNGVLTPNFFANLQYSAKTFQFAGYGGTLKDIQDSPRICFTTNCAFGQPYFDATDPENRNNTQWAGSLNYFLSSAKLGSHDIKAGFEVFSSISIGGNSQSATDYSIYNDYVVDAQGNPVFDANHHLIPDWITQGGLLIHWFATRGAQSTIRTSAFFLNDVWRLGNLTANLGMRYETVHGTGPENTTVANSSSIVPRLGVSYDVKGDGRYTISGTYAQYAGGYNPSAFNSITNVGNPNYVYYFYVGPPGQGYNFAPGYDLNNYALAGGNFPTANVSLASGLKSPHTSEFTVSVGGQILKDVNAAITYVNRDTTNFIEDFVTFDQGTTDVIVDGVDFGTFDNKVFRNTNQVTRKYQAINLQGRANVGRNFFVQVGYTYMIQFDGNAEEEAGNQPFSPSGSIGNYPELNVPSRNYPLGRLAGYQKNKLRIIPNYTLPTHFGNFNFGLIYSYDSGTPYNFRALNQPYSDIQLSRDPGYALPPNTQTLYFGSRGAGTFPGQSQFDLAFTYDIPVWQTLTPWLQLRITNLFDTQYRTGFNTTIKACSNPATAGCNGAAPVDANGLPTTYTTVGTPFGTVTANSQYQTAQTFQINVGVRF